MHFSATRSPASKGFTMVELLVVIAVIGLLGIVAFASLQGVRKKSHDIKRKSDIEQMSLAIRQYKENYGRYPSAADGACTHNTSLLPGGCMEVLVRENILPALPVDPLPSHHYYYDNWCREGESDQKFRMWTDGESYTGGTVYPCDIAGDGCWWVQTTIGATNCTDPS